MNWRSTTTFFDCLKHFYLLVDLDIPFLNQLDDCFLNFACSQWGHNVGVKPSLIKSCLDNLTFKVVRRAGYHYWSDFFQQMVLLV